MDTTGRTLIPSHNDGESSLRLPAVGSILRPVPVRPTPTMGRNVSTDPSSTTRSTSNLSSFILTLPNAAADSSDTGAAPHPAFRLKMRREARDPMQAFGETENQGPSLHFQDPFLPSVAPQTSAPFSREGNHQRMVAVQQQDAEASHSNNVDWLSPRESVSSDNKVSATTPMTMDLSDTTTPCTTHSHSSCQDFCSPPVLHHNALDISMGGESENLPLHILLPAL